VPERPRLQLTFLDGLRGLAALFVVVHHARMLLWEGYSSGYKIHPQLYSTPTKLVMALFMAFANGHVAVLFFFVLSGFVIHLKYAATLNETPAARLDWLDYAWRRIKRLYPPLIFALLLTSVLDALGGHFGFPIYGQPTPYPNINRNVIPVHDAWTLLGNLAFLMQSHVRVWGTNGPLWSLHYEWWFYVLYPVFCLMSRRSILPATGFIVVLFGLSFVPSLWHGSFLQGIFGLMLSWWLGVLLAESYVGRLRVPFRPLALLLLVGPLALVWPHAPSDAADTLYAFSFAGLLALCFDRLQTGKLPVFLERLKPLGDLSYSLYVIHFPILALMSGWLMSRSSSHTLPMHFGWVAVGIVVSLGAAYPIHLLVERPFTSRRRTGEVQTPPATATDRSQQP